MKTTPLNPTESAPVAPVSPDVPDALAWRGDVGLFPTAPGLTYREFAAETNATGFGDGLLGPDPANRQKNMSIEGDPAGYARAEMIIFGNGLIVGPECWVNDTPVPMKCLSELAVGKEAYPTCSYSVNRTYNLALVPLALLKAGRNSVRVPKCHAYLQTAVLRLFRAEPDAGDLRLEVERAGANYRLRLTGADVGQVKEAQFFARCDGPDLAMTGQEVTWQGAINKNAEREEDYEVSNHCGTVSAAPWEVTWDAKLVPSGPIQFRSRVKTAEGFWIESPGAIVEQAHEAAKLIIPLRAADFAPWGFHLNGANQNKSFSCEFQLRGGAYRALEGRQLKRAILAVPLYGTIKFLLNNDYPFEVEAPQGGLHLRHVELPVEQMFSRMNHLTMKPSRKTGCFQSPGPVLYMIYDK
jgi:hypothetical protein